MATSVGYGIVPLAQIRPIWLQHVLTIMRGSGSSVARALFDSTMVIIVAQSVLRWMTPPSTKGLDLNSYKNVCSRYSRSRQNELHLWRCRKEKDMLTYDENGRSFWRHKSTFGLANQKRTSICGSMWPVCRENSFKFYLYHVTLIDRYRLCRS